MDFGEKIRELRVGQKLTQRQLADRLGISKSAISYYEGGDKIPSIDVMFKIARAFNVTTDYLFGIERKQLIDVSDLSDENVAIIIAMVNALKDK